LDVEDGLARIDERLQPSALVVVDALLVHGEVEGWLEAPDLAEVVLEADGEPPVVRELREEHVEADLIGGGQREPGVVRVAVDVVEVDGVETLRRACSYPSGDDRSD